MGPVILECLGTIGEGVHDLVAVREGRVGNVLVKKLYRIAESIAVGTLDVEAVSTIMFR